MNSTVSRIKKFYRVIVTALILLPLISLNAQVEYKRFANDGEPFDLFGNSVAVSSNYALVGSYHDDDNGLNSGAAYIFYRGDWWTEQQKLVPSDSHLYQGFGSSLALEYECAIIGACGDDENGYHSGSAYIFSYKGGRWVEDQILVPDDGNPHDYLVVPYQYQVRQYLSVPAVI